MNYWSKKPYVGGLLLVGLLSSAHAVYVGGNPLSYTDPTGLDAAALPASGIRFPGGVGRNAATFPGAETYYIPKNGPIPDAVTRRLSGFNGGTP